MSASWFLLKLKCFLCGWKSLKEKQTWPLLLSKVKYVLFHNLSHHLRYNKWVLAACWSISWKCFSGAAFDRHVFLNFAELRQNSGSFDSSLTLKTFNWNKSFLRIISAKEKFKAWQTRRPNLASLSSDLTTTSRGRGLANGQSETIDGFATGAVCLPLFYFLISFKFFFNCGANQ